MRSRKIILGIAALVLVALGVDPDQTQRLLQLFTGEQTTSVQTSASSGTSASHDQKWSNTDPAINLHHVFDGEINRSGKPTGFHSRPSGTNPATARVISVRDGPNQLGVYTATIEVRDGSNWKEKFSSFFPDNMSRQDVINTVLHAYRNSDNPNAQPWRGPSGLGFDVQGYTLRDGDINTAFPVYER